MAVSKAVKIVKTFLVLKCTKKLSSLREGLSTGESNEKIEKELEMLETLKALDHALVAASIVRLKVSFGNDPKYNAAGAKTDSAISPALLKIIMSHKRIEDTLAEIQSKITTTIEKNNELRAKEQSKAATKKAKSIFSKKDGVYVDGTKAVFMDSLDALPESETKKVENRDLVKLNKSLRNQMNRMNNRTSKKPEEQIPFNLSTEGNKYDNSDPSLNMYRSLDQRYPSNPATEQQQRGAPGGRREPSRANDRSSSAGGNRPSTAPDRRGGSAPGRAKPAAHAVLPAADLTKAASFGKEWKTTGVHPSWAAKQHAKQQSVGSIPSAGAAAGAGLGKKIVFED